MAGPYVKGGDKLSGYLRSAESQAGETRTLHVGFLEGSAYPDGMSVPLVAFNNEFGSTINREPSQVTIYRKMNKAGTGFLRKGRFVKRRESNFASTHATPAYTINIPPRPFFRNMVKKHKGEWAKEAAKRFKSAKWDVSVVMQQMGALLASQLQASIYSNTPPPNAPSTVRRKGHSQTLIDTGYMASRVDWDVIS